MSASNEQSGDRAAGMWGGRFEGAIDPLFRQFNDSLPVDHVLVEYDIRGSIAWAEALADAGVLTDEECDNLEKALNDILQAVRNEPHLLLDASDEDVHGWVERELIERVGDLGRKLHTGRSRNDQVATDLRMYARDEIRVRQSEIRALQKALVELGERNLEAVIPGYTHLQRGQPVLFAHWCFAYFEMLDRDLARFADAFGRANVCPLGSGALAGTSFPIDRTSLAAALDFDRPSDNSLDAVSDRDFVLETLFCAHQTALHLSRMAEDLIIYSTAEFGFIEMSDAVTSGSSLMPQKKNPDAMELIRGKAGRIFGDLAALSMTMKGSPLAYNKDFQEDKQPLFDSMRELSMCLRMAVRALADLRVNAQRARAAAEGGHANATAFANYLVAKGIAFREAHEITGRIVRHALQAGMRLEDLPLDELQSFSERIDADICEHLSLDSVIGSCDVHGGTAPQRVSDALREAGRKVAATES